MPHKPKIAFERTFSFGKKRSCLRKKTIKKYARSYILKIDTQKLTIDTTIITANSLQKLNAELEKLILKGIKSTGTNTM
jgi:hypothetical protein